MSIQVVRILRTVFSNMWGFFNSFEIPGFYFTPAQFFLGVLVLFALWRFLNIILRRMNNHSAGSSYGSRMNSQHKGD